MKNVAQRLIGPVLVFLMLGSAAGCQFGSSVEMEEVRGPVVRVHGTKPETITPVLAVTFQATNDIDTCRTMQMTGRTVPNTRQLTVWPGDELGPEYSSISVSVHRSTDMLIKQVECSRETSRRRCHYFKFDALLGIENSAACGYKVSSLTVNLGFVGTHPNIERHHRDGVNPDYGDRLGGFRVVSTDISSYHKDLFSPLPDTVDVQCRRTGKENADIERPIDCVTSDLRNLGYRVPSISKDTLVVRVNVGLIE